MTEEQKYCQKRNPYNRAFVCYKLRGHDDPASMDYDPFHKYNPKNPEGIEWLWSEDDE